MPLASHQRILRAGHGYRVIQTPAEVDVGLEMTNLGHLREPARDPSASTASFKVFPSFPASRSGRSFPLAHFTSLHEVTS
jgi:hypothetical protein